MQAYDLLMLIVLGMAAIFGAIKGFAWQVASLASILVSYIVAYRFRFDVAEMIQAKPPWNQFLAMLILYVGTSFVIWVGFRLFSGMIDRVRLKEFDRHLGAGFGLLKGAVYCLLITMFAMSLLGPNQQAAICQSRSGYYISVALDRGVGVLPKEIHDVVGPYLANLDAKLNQHDGHDHTQTTDPSGQGGASPIWPGGLSELGLGNIPALPELPLPGSGTNWGQGGFGGEQIQNQPLFPPNNGSSGIFPPQNLPAPSFPNQSLPSAAGGVFPGTAAGGVFPGTQPAGGQNTASPSSGLRPLPR